ncbi:GH3 family domain-containing protein [Anaerostipes faecalis]|uniref:GH3 family domain-containing protein n=1 Tax=Anaerostipes faecalis TaxID=2738446 RepID=UPI003F11A54A
MKFEEKLRERDRKEIWDEYCGFLDLSMEDYMHIQKRLLMEQMSLWCNSKLGQDILDGKMPRDIDEFRQMVPLTTYEDYADVLLSKQKEMLPDEPIIWIQTTWEGGKHPIKVAPYTRSMLDTYTHNVLACLILSTSNQKGEFDVKVTDNILYALAPLPYATGLFPLALKDQINIGFLPPVKDAVKMSFGERNVKGFKMGLSEGIEFFFGLGSVAYFVSMSIADMQKKGGEKKGMIETLSKLSPSMIIKLIRAKQKCRKENRQLKPKDLFKLKGFMCAGTDNYCYKDDLEELWGVRPMELFAGTEPTCIGTETWTRNGMYFFPDACFYEFIPESEMEKSFIDPEYQPKTFLMDEVIPGEKYEIAITVLKGGAFARYRVGDVYRCVGLKNKEDETVIPRFQYVDRIPTIIDIGGFTRISENSISDVIQLSGLPIKNWVALKEYTENNRPYLHLYVEMEKESLETIAINKEILKNHLSVYFKYLDQDYKDLKRILGIDPLEITILKCGTFDKFESRGKQLVRRVNPPYQETAVLLEDYVAERGGISYE